ncbi:MAG: hypothetical protein E5Y29_06875 [Mesorhizobium sp.]|nr:MAG: hypothetical protein E5Y29_06875 [Mesorhizobium sp.]
MRHSVAVQLPSPISSHAKAKLPCEMQQRRWEHRYCTMWKSLVAAVAHILRAGHLLGLLLFPVAVA